MPEFVPPPDPQADRYPLALTCAKPRLFCQTQHRALPSLRRRAMDPEVMLHPETAARRGIAAGDWVSVETQAGASAAQRQYRFACCRGRAWLVASGPRGTPANIHLCVSSAMTNQAKETLPQKSMPLAWA